MLVENRKIINYELEKEIERSNSHFPMVIFYLVTFWLVWRSECSRSSRITPRSWNWVSTHVMMSLLTLSAGLLYPSQGHEPYCPSAPCWTEIHVIKLTFPLLHSADFLSQSCQTKLLAHCCFEDGQLPQEPYKWVSGDGVIAKCVSCCQGIRLQKDPGWLTAVCVLVCNQPCSCRWHRELHVLYVSLSALDVVPLAFCPRYTPEYPSQWNRQLHH